MTEVGAARPAKPSGAHKTRLGGRALQGLAEPKREGRAPPLQMGVRGQAR